MIDSENPEIDVTTLGQRIQEQVSRGSGDGLIALRDDSDIAAAYARVRWEHEAPVIHWPAAAGFEREVAPGPDGHYRLADLVRLRDVDFVAAIYRAVLRREGDALGMAHFLEQLRAGASKVDLVWALRHSPEGRAAGAVVTGLPGRFSAYAFARAPIVGPIARLLRALWQLPRAETRLREAQARVEQAEVAAREHEAALRTGLGGFTASTARTLESGAAALAQAQEALLANVGRRLLRHRLYAEEVRKSIHRGRNDVLALQQAARADRRAAEDDLKALAASSQQKLEAGEARIGDLEAAHAAAIAPDHSLDAFFVRFEDHFRGSPEEIRQRQQVYLPWVEVARAATQAPALDIGCGRGEWLALLAEVGQPARGIELNRDFVAAGRERGLDIAEADAVAYLRGLEAGSLGVVTAFHVIEHLSLPDLVAVLDEALRVLKPGGVLILETPNPGNLSVGAHTFWLDPTHRKPLPFLLMHVMLELRGFADVAVKGLHPDPQGDSVTGTGTPLDHAVREALYSSRDYAVIGWKRAAP